MLNARLIKQVPRYRADKNYYAVPQFLPTFVTLIFFACSTIGDDLDEANKEYLRKFGYLELKDRSLSSSIMSAEIISGALKNFQRMAGLEQTGILNKETKEMMEAPRCGVSDSLNRDTRRRKRYTLFGTKWYQKEISYMFSNYGEDLTKTKVESTIAKAFEYWQNVSSLKFKKSSSSAIIDIAFRVGAHGDEDNFDGPGGTLAHAFFPMSSSMGGDMHFDDEETWTFNENRGTNLLQVAVHELGHSLGLAHSEVRDAIMAPFYTGYTPNLKLHNDDIRGIQAIYGPPKDETDTDDEEPDPQEPPAAEGVCGVTSPDAMFTLLEIIFIFKDDNLFALDGFYDKRAKEYSIEDIFPELPSNIDAAFSFEHVVRYRKLNYLYFFKGDKVWKYRYQDKFYLFKYFPKKISQEFPGIPGNLSAAFEWNLNGKKYFFKGTKYYRFSDSLKKVSFNYPRNITNFNLGIDKVDAVFNHPSKGISGTYFLSDGQIYKYDDITDKVARGFPRPLRWLTGCNSEDSFKNFKMKVIDASSSSTHLSAGILFIVCFIVQLFFKF